MSDFEKFKLGYADLEGGRVEAVCYCAIPDCEDEVNIFNGEYLTSVERDRVYDVPPSEEELKKWRIRVIQGEIDDLKDDLKAHEYEERELRLSLKRLVAKKEKKLCRKAELKAKIRELGGEPEAGEEPTYV